jgi:hypothetical protein
MTLYDITNPTLAARVIYNGIPSESGKQREIHIPAGGHKEEVELSDVIARELRERNKAKPGSELVLRLSSAKNDTETPHKAAVTTTPQPNKK